MVILHPLSDFIDCDRTLTNLSPTYWYEGRCPQTGELLRLPRNGLVEAIAYTLMQYLATDDRYSREGKMYGVLLVEQPSGEQGILKAFSGLLNGSSIVEGWVPPIPGREQVVIDEARTLTELETIKQELITLKQLTQRQQYEMLSREFELRLQTLSSHHKNYKQQRQEKRQICVQTLTGEVLKLALEQLDEESRQAGIERRRLKHQRDEALQPLQQMISAADARIRELKQQRKELSRQLQAEMHAAYSVMNFLGKSRSLQQLMPQGLPTGTGDCCAPKLLHYAATQNLKPLAMAEFWWGSSCANGDKIQGEFYGACVERCQPLMGFLLSGLSQNYIVSPATVRQEINESKNPSLRGKGEQEIGFKPLSASGRGWGGVRSQSDSTNSIVNDRLGESKNLTPQPPSLRGKGGQEIGFKPLSASGRGWGGVILDETEQMLPIIYEDEWLIAINKPAGLLSVPGRYLGNQDSVLSRLRNLLPDGNSLAAIHRLDLETSGIILIARDLPTYRQLSQQFQQRQVRKVYEAVLADTVTADQGVIELPLWGNPENRPYQQVDWQHGKPSVTNFQVMAREENCTRIEFMPITGRTHQLRVHAADVRGLGIPILGDRLYGCLVVASRLNLHARELCFQHPQSGKKVELHAIAPF